MQSYHYHPEEVARHSSRTAKSSSTGMAHGLHSNMATRVRCQMKYKKLSGFHHTPLILPELQGTTNLLQDPHDPSAPKHGHAKASSSQMPILLKCFSNAHAGSPRDTSKACYDSSELGMHRWARRRISCMKLLSVAKAVGNAVPLSNRYAQRARVDSLGRWCGLVWDAVSEGKPAVFT